MAILTPRRSVLGTTGALFSWAFLPRFAQAAGARDPRFVVIVLRGALDGLTAVPPVGDPSYRELRQSIALTLDGPHPALKVDGFFALDPSMPNLARLYHANQAAIVHACATAYRDRSHFDGQDVLESGYPGPGHVESGWLNRLLLTLQIVDLTDPVDVGDNQQCGSRHREPGDQGVDPARTRHHRRLGDRRRFGGAGVSGAGGQVALGLGDRLGPDIGDLDLRLGPAASTAARVAGRRHGGRRFLAA